MSDPLQYLLAKAPVEKLHVEGDRMPERTILSAPGEDPFDPALTIPVPPSRVFYKTRLYHASADERFMDAFADCLSEAWTFRPSGGLFLDVFSSSAQQLPENLGTIDATLDEFPFDHMDRWDVALHRPGYPGDYESAEQPEMFLRFRGNRKGAALVGSYSSDYAAMIGARPLDARQLLALPDPAYSPLHPILRNAPWWTQSLERFTETYFGTSIRPLSKLRWRLERARQHALPPLTAEVQVVMENRDDEEEWHLVTLRHGMDHENALALLLRQFGVFRQQFDAGECDGEPELSRVYDICHPDKEREIN